MDKFKLYFVHSASLASFLYLILFIDQAPLEQLLEDYYAIELDTSDIE